MSRESSPRLVAGWIFFAFGVWIFTFRGYLISKYSLESDALSYCDHTRFFIENLARGVYPLWDPFWYHGVPNDFFLRRIGALNPLYLGMLGLKSLGIPFTLSYLWCLAGYYWSAMAAFYLLAMRLYHDRLIAYAGYLMLMFSALGTRIFDSYMMLVTVPLIWFFYFLVAFTQTPRKHFFTGMVLSFLILVNTYIPIYFLIILGLFIFLYALIYFRDLAGTGVRYRDFCISNKVLVIASSVLLVFSFVSTLMFFHDFSRGQVVLPDRHGSMGVEHVLTVPRQTLDWGAVEDFFYSAYFSNLRLYKFAVVYVPFFSVIVMMLGLVGCINRRAVLLFLSGFVLFCCIVPHGLPFYDFFYRHVFFLKYFRNLHFFIWFYLIPLFVLLALEHWQMFSEFKSSQLSRRWLSLGIVWCVHLIVAAFVWWRQDAVVSTSIMVCFSLLLWSLFCLDRLKANWGGYCLLTLTVLVQPLEVYHYFSLKGKPHANLSYNDQSYRSFKIKDNSSIKPGDTPEAKEDLYYASHDFNFIYHLVSNYALAKYLQNKFILVDHLNIVDRDTLSSRLEKYFLSDDNSAFIYEDNKTINTRLDGNDPQPSFKAQRLTLLSQGFKLLSFDANHIRIDLNIPYEKFLIYNDNFDPLWRVSINHHDSRLYEVNGAFKGAWVPAGKSEIEFSYAPGWSCGMNILLSLIAFLLLAGIIGQACL